MSIDRIAVVGGGTMGNGIAHVAAQSGKSVKLLDISEEVLTSAMATIGKNLDRQVKKSVLDEAGKADVLGRIEIGTDLAAGVADVDLVVEAAPEKMELKRQIFATLDASAPQGAILATNTSSWRRATRRPPRWWSSPRSSARRRWRSTTSRGSWRTVSFFP
jgi:3-hydroxybutyryl-CoA dehydrogenase